MAPVKELVIEVDADSSYGEFKGVYLNKAGEKKDFCIRSMHDCYLHIGAKYPLPISIPLGDEGKPLSPGLYDIDPKSFFDLGARGQLGLSREWVLTHRSAPVAGAASRT